MSVIIPKSIIKEIGLLNKGVKIKKKEEPIFPPEELFKMAEDNVAFLNEIANTEPINLFLKKKEIIIFSKEKSAGYIILSTKFNKTAVFDWRDADYPANRRETDYRFLDKARLETWQRWNDNDFPKFALLTKREIWKIINKWLRMLRTQI